MGSTIELSTSQIQELYQLARAAREKAYCPYSGYQVGAAIRVAEGKIYTGCNVENSSYGATNCAERVAIQKAISEQGRVQIWAVMVVTDASPPWPPCGMCRQVIAEFSQDCVIYAANLQGELQTTRFAELLPQAFTPQYLTA